MNPATARRWVVTSALVVGVVYGYRYVVEGEGSGNLMSVPEFFTAWGVVYLVLGIAAEFAPRFAGPFALTIMAGDLLAQSKQVAADVTKKTGTPTTKTTTTGATGSTGAGVTQPGGGGREVGAS